MHNRMLFVAVCCVMAVPMAEGHGGAAPREVDTRLLSDGDALFDFGALGDAGAPVDPLHEGGMDLLSLDIREAATANGTHVVWFRVIGQLGDPAAGTHSVRVMGEANGAHEFRFESDDLDTWRSLDGFLTLSRPEIGDAHVHAFEAAIPAAIFGGAALSDIRVESWVGEDREDLMPGAYEVQGVTVPSDAEPANYALQGPARLADVALEAAVVEGCGAYRFSLTGSNILQEMDQFVTVSGPWRGDALVANASSIAWGLGPGFERSGDLVVEGVALEVGDVLRVISDLGAFAVLPLDVAALDDTAMCGPLEPMEPGDDGSAGDVGGDGHSAEDKDAGGAAWLLLAMVGGGVLLAWLLRR